MAPEGFTLAASQGLLERIFVWLNTHSGAVTALAAIAGVFIIGFYTYTTRKLANIAAQQRDILAAQHNMQATQVQYMLYERRFKVLEAVLNIVAKAREHSDISYTAISKFDAETAENRYIFGEDIQGYIKEFTANVRQIQMLYHDLQQMFDDDHNAQDVIAAHEEKIEKMRAWFVDQDDEAPRRFAPYLKIQE